MTVAIRPAVAADVPAMHRIRLSVQENRLSNPALVREGSYLPYLEAGNAWVAERNAAIAGFAALDRSAGSIWALFVAPEAEGLGIGRSLLDRLFPKIKLDMIAHHFKAVEADPNR